jgi:hypothetical protein
MWPLKSALAPAGPAQLTRRAFTASLLALGACGAPGTGHEQARILLFDGTGASPGDVTAIGRLLRHEGLPFDTANSRQLARIGEERLGSYRLLIVPGGNFEVMGNGLPRSASAAIRASVRAGLNYLGICAGAFFAGDSPYNGANLTDGAHFGFYALEAQGIRKAVVPISLPGAAPIEHYWEDGPDLAGWGEPIALYPDGAPAAVQGRVGGGWVVLVGFHPEAEGGWRRGMRFSSPVSAAQAHAATLIHAALDGRRLPHF